MMNCEEHLVGRPYTVDSSASGRIHLAGSYALVAKRDVSFRRALVGEKLEE
jgi:hypothetical protein